MTPCSPTATRRVVEPRLHDVSRRTRLQRPDGGPYSLGQPFPDGSTRSYPIGRNPTGDSRLLKVDNRGTCQLCHDPTYTEDHDQYTRPHADTRRPLMKRRLPAAAMQRLPGPATATQRSTNDPVNQNMRPPSYRARSLFGLGLVCVDSRPGLHARRSEHRRHRSDARASRHARAVRRPDAGDHARSVARAVRRPDARAVRRPDARAHARSDARAHARSLADT